MVNALHSVNTVDGQESRHKLILDSKWMEKNAESSKNLVIKSLTGGSIVSNYGNQASCSFSSIGSNTGISGEIIEQTMNSARSIDLSKVSHGSSTPEVKMSPRTPIQVKNVINTRVEVKGPASKVVVGTSGDGATNMSYENQSPRQFNLAEQLEKLSVSTGNVSHHKPGTITVNGVPMTAAASYVMLSRDLSSSTHVRRVDSARIIRRGYSDDVSNMMKRGGSGNRLLKTQSNNSARSVRTPAEYGHVYLNIYDLEAVNKVVNVVAGTFGAGAYHAGVEIYGHEYNFGYTPQGGTGVVQSFPRYHASHKYRRSIDLGKTKFSPREVLEIIERLKPLWLGSSYDILKKNCLNFADAFCKELEVGGIPSWVMGLQNKINWTRESIQSGAAKLKQLDEAVGISRVFGSLSRKLTGECTRGNS